MAVERQRRNKVRERDREGGRRSRVGIKPTTFIYLQTENNLHRQPERNRSNRSRVIDQYNSVVCIEENIGLSQ